jgi:hypothetical protein
MYRFFVDRPCGYGMDLTRQRGSKRHLDVFVRSLAGSPINDSGLHGCRIYCCQIEDRRPHDICSSGLPSILRNDALWQWESQPIADALENSDIAKQNRCAEFGDGRIRQ